MGAVTTAGIHVVSGADPAQLQTNVRAFFTARTLDVTGGYTVTPLTSGLDGPFHVLIVSTASA